LNGSPDQGNLGGNASNSVQQPTGDGSSPSQNLTLGLNSNAKLGQYLIAYNGMTLYTFAKDKKGTTTCYSACATNWPPYIVTPGMQINLQAGIDGAFSTVTRTDGTMQLAYKGMPLYFYAKDAVSGDTKGEGVGKVWYVVKP
jgi:predicted lipoprotein with Yx(FWY)xxD motif